VSPRRAFACLIALAVLGGCAGGGAGTPGAPPPPTATPTGGGGSGGIVIIPVPTPAPVICSPSPVAVSVNQSVAVNCAAAHYGGPYTFTVANPTIASVTQANGSFTNYFVTGLRSGTTTLTLHYGSSGVGSVAIDVH